jgi:hypothetical protein
MVHDLETRSEDVAPVFLSAMNPPLSSTFRVGILLFAAILGVQCVWLLLAELSRPGFDHLPTDPQSAATASQGRNDATWAAWIGALRGDLWAESAYTYADLLWVNSSNDSELTKPLDQARRRLDRAARYAPHQAGAWLLLAGLATRYRWSKPNPAEALRMSYYTGPSELALVPLRSLVATEQTTLDDELQQLVRRDLRLLIAQGDKPAIIQDYQSATPSGKQFIEQVLGEIDPPFGASLRQGSQ